MNKKKLTKRPLTRKQKAFADIILANPTITAKAAAKQVFNVRSDRIAEVVGSEYQRKPEIMQYMADHAREAEEGILEIAGYSKEMGQTFSKEGASYAAVAVTAYKDVLDRVHGKPTQRIEQSTTGVTLSIDLTSALSDN